MTSLDPPNHRPVIDIYYLVVMNALQMLKPFSFGIKGCKILIQFHFLLFCFQIE